MTKKRIGVVVYRTAVKNRRIKIALWENTKFKRNSFKCFHLCRREALVGNEFVTFWVNRYKPSGFPLKFSSPFFVRDTQLTVKFVTSIFE